MKLKVFLFLLVLCPLPGESYPPGERFEKELADEFMEFGRTIIWYHGSLTCHHRGFCASLYYQEDDTGADDPLAYVGLHCTDGYELRHSAMVLFEDGDGYFDHNYEPFVEILHDCGTKKKKNIIHLPRVPDLKHHMRWKFHQYSIQLTQTGHTIGHGDIEFYRKFWEYEVDPHTIKWANHKDMTQYPSLFEYKRTYWIKKTTDRNDDYCACYTSSESGARDNICYNFYHISKPKTIAPYCG